MFSGFGILEVLSWVHIKAKTCLNKFVIALFTSDVGFKHISCTVTGCIICAIGWYSDLSLSFATMFSTYGRQLLLYFFIGFIWALAAFLHPSVIFNIFQV